MLRRASAEGIGTFAAVFTGCAALLVGGDRLGDVGVAVAFGLGLSVATFAVAPISGGHMNPAVTWASALLGRIAPREALAYIAAQLAGGAAAAAIALQIASGRPGGAPLAVRALENGYGSLSPGFYGLGAAFAAELVLTAIFVFAWLGASRELPRGRLAALPAIAGLAYGLVNLVGRPVTNLAANPARAFGAALFAGPEAISQLWLFFAAPLAGATLAALAYGLLVEPRAEVDVDKRLEAKG